MLELNKAHHLVSAHVGLFYVAYLCRPSADSWALVVLGARLVRIVCGMSQAPMIGVTGMSMRSMNPIGPSPRAVFRAAGGCISRWR